MVKTGLPPALFNEILYFAMADISIVNCRTLYINLKKDSALMFIIICKQVIKMALMIGLGALCYRKKLISHEGSVTISNLLLLVITPALIITSFQLDYERRILYGMLAALLLSVISHVIGIVLCTLVLKKDPADHYVIERFSGVFSNCGFMGIPLINALFGAEGVIYLTVYIALFNTLTWTYGYGLMTGSHSLREMKGGLRSPVIFSIVIGILLFILRIRLPEIIFDTGSYIASMNTPAAMLLAGATLAESDLATALRNRGVYRVALLRLIIIPLLCLLAFMLLPVDPQIRCIILIATACPAATNSTLFALRFHKDYVYSSQIFALVTAFSLITIPLMVLVCEYAILR